ncbi:hypothetical protein [Rummeliibacillus pycnus]|uniref:hypothetical protein n=1 Tax=Rummeliibacillus pycnus TaxID=101070 RepID=UPI003D2AB20B
MTFNCMTGTKAWKTDKAKVLVQLDVLLLTIQIELVLRCIVWLTIIILVINIIRKCFLKPIVLAAFNKTSGIVLVLSGIFISTEKA